MRGYRLATSRRGKAYVFGAWKDFKSCCDDLLKLSDLWQMMGLRVIFRAAGTRLTALDEEGIFADSAVVADD